MNFQTFKQLKTFIEMSSTNIQSIGYKKEQCSGVTRNLVAMNLYYNYGNVKTFFFNDSESILNYFNKFFNFNTMEIVEPTSPTL